MISDLRFVEREIEEHDISNDWHTVRKVRVLQMKVEAYGWIDVPLVKDTE